MKKGQNSIPKFLRSKAAKDPAKQKAKKELPPGAGCIPMIAGIVIGFLLRMLFGLHEVLK